MKLRDHFIEAVYHNPRQNPFISPSCLILLCSAFLPCLSVLHTESIFFITDIIEFNFKKMLVPHKSGTRTPCSRLSVQKDTLFETLNSELNTLFKTEDPGPKTMPCWATLARSYGQITECPPPLSREVIITTIREIKYI